jgi:anaerobic selenocysteine-containing dehydrogenase
MLDELMRCVRLRGVFDSACPDSTNAVRVWNDRGECQLVARITGRVKPGVAVALSIWWNKLSPGRANVNQTVSQALTDIGAGATFFDNLVEVAKN